MQEAVGGQNLLSIYGVYEKLKGRGGAATASASTSTPATGAASTQPPQQAQAKSEATKGAPTPESERLKAQGNAAIASRDYPAAITAYTSALTLSPLNPIYLSNRAAAYSGSGSHDLARQDAELAVAADPNYSKAWSRLGLARFALGDAAGSMEAYKRGMEAEGNGGSESMRKGYETAKRKVEEETSRDAGAGPDIDGTAAAHADPAPAAAGGGMPDLSALLGGMGGAGGAGGGGMPDLSALMQNPMMRQMAQNVMQNPEMLGNLMNNPQLRNMASRFGGAGGAGAGGDAGAAGGAGAGGGGMPDISAMLNDPAMMEM